MPTRREDTLTENQIERSKDRAHLIMSLWFFVIIIMLGRAFYIEVIRHGYYTTLADKQYISNTPIDFDRGTIYFSHHNGDLVPVAQLSTTYRIAIDPAAITNRDLTYNRLSSFISLDKEVFMEKAGKIEDPYEEIAKDVSPDTVAKMKKINLPGVVYVKDNKRAYTQDTIGSKVVGFVGNNGVTVRGQYGVERYYNDVLTRSSSERTVNFFAELFANVEQTIVSNTDKEQGDIVLTIDSEAERTLHTILEETQKQWRSDIIGGIIMDPKTGAIIAMDTLPSFNPNSFSQVKDSSLFLNQNVSGVYEMGSIIKPLTMAAAIDSGVINEATTTYNDTGFREFNGFKVRNYDLRARGPNTSMQTILSESLNVGISFLVNDRLGIDRFQTYFKKFGLGDETGIDLPAESAGLTKNLNSTVMVDSVTAGFGQGIAITPIQTIRALAVLGNGGKLVTPHVVSSIVYQNGTTKKIAPEDPVQVISPDTSERITRMLVRVVDTALQHGADKMQHYTIASKTGTAQIPQPGGGYYSDRYLHSFFGYFPAYDPRFIIFLYHVNPKGAEYASATLSDPFFKLVKFLISYYEVPPDR